MNHRRPRVRDGFSIPNIMKKDIGRPNRSTCGNRFWCVTAVALPLLVFAAHLVLRTGVLLAQSQPLPPSNLRLLGLGEEPPPPPPPPPSGGGSGTLGGWPMAGATLQRTSNSVADVSTVNGIAWYRPIEAFISGTTQLITAGGRVYVATARGLVVLNAENGALVCRFDTELPVATRHRGRHRGVRPWLRSDALLAERVDLRDQLAIHRRERRLQRKSARHRRPCLHRQS